MARLALILITFVCGLLIGCSGGGAPVSKLPAYLGLPRAQVVTKLGTPQQDSKYPMSGAVGEFRVGLQNTYPLSRPANASVQIEEMTWDDGGYWITLWLHQVNGAWVVLDSCRWQKGTQF